MLRFFPTPYPGESIYSILCRYHQRSGNRSHRQTRNELFEFPVSLLFTIVAPLYFFSIKAWNLPESSISWYQLVQEHSVLPLLEFLVPDEVDNYRNTLQLSHATSKIPSAWSVSARVASCFTAEFRSLRYCPHCAREQILTYGEPYWEILPQCWNVILCPVHGTPYMNSNVHEKKIANQFVPASRVVLLDVQSPAAPSKESLDFHISRTMRWLMDNTPYLMPFICQETELLKPSNLPKLKEKVASSCSLPSQYFSSVYPKIRSALSMLSQGYRTFTDILDIYELIAFLAGYFRTNDELEQFFIKG